MSLPANQGSDNFNLDQSFAAVHFGFLLKTLGSPMQPKELRNLVSLNAQNSNNRDL